jgi:hypothetical protein
MNIIHDLLFVVLHTFLVYNMYFKTTGDNIMNVEEAIGLAMLVGAVGLIIYQYFFSKLDCYRDR